MESADKAGGSCSCGGIALIPFAVAFLWMSRVYPSLMIFFWILVTLISVYLFYAAWGSFVGNNETAWDDYSESVDKSTREGAKKECRKQGVEPPAWL